MVKSWCPTQISINGFQVAGECAPNGDFQVSSVTLTPEALENLVREKVAELIGVNPYKVSVSVNISSYEDADLKDVKCTIAK